MCSRSWWRKCVFSFFLAAPLAQKQFPEKKKDKWEKQSPLLILTGFKASSLWHKGHTNMHDHHVNAFCLILLPLSNILSYYIQHILYSPIFNANTNILPYLGLVHETFTPLQQALTNFNYIILVQTNFFSLTKIFK